MSDLAVLPIDWERKKIDEVKKLLDDVPCCRKAAYTIEWITDPIASERTKVPILVLSFPEFEKEGATPAYSFRLTTAVSNTVLEGEKLKKHLRASVEQFFMKNGIVVEMPTDEVKVVVNA